MAAPAMAPTEGPKYHPEGKEGPPKFMTRLPNGETLFAVDRDDMIRQLREYKEGVN